MIGYRRAVAVCVMALGVAFSPAAAQEEPAPKKPEATPPPAEPPKKKDPFFGDHFALYLEVRGGPASIRNLENPVTSGPDSSTASEIQFNGSQAGLFTVGWTLPRNRGQYLFTYNGLTDGSYDLKATGYQRSYAGNEVLADELPWWHLTIDNGHSRATKTPPVWDLSQDANGNGLPDTNEFRYPNTTVDLSGTVPDKLNNQLQTFDLYYKRDWGGLRYHGAWTAGIRYLDFQGVVPTPAWVIGSKQIIGFGFTDAVATKLLLMQQSTSGWGPIGSGEAQFNFFRQRLSLYIMGQAALLEEKLNADSGPFTYYAFQSVSAGQILAIPGFGDIQRDVSKTAWNTAVEVGARIKVLDGFHVIVDWNTTGYLDTVLLPDTLSTPANAAQVSLGAVATYVSRDIVRSTINVGLSFQF